MGKGKGNPEVWVAVVKRGHIICEVAGFDEVSAREALKQATYKLPLKTKFVKKEECASIGFIMKVDEIKQELASLTVPELTVRH